MLQFISIQPQITQDFDMRNPSILQTIAEQQKKEEKKKFYNIL